MTHPSIAYCTHCARPGNRRTAVCPSCGASRVMTPGEHAGHVAFLLNELHLPPLADALVPTQQDAVAKHYETEVWRLLSPAPAKSAAAAGQESPRPAAPAPRLDRSTIGQAMAASAPAAPTQRPPAPPAPPTRTREPFDWGLLAEHQANLLLFAGAFLTVVAALIYVGYSGQAVGGALKMGLLAGYTLAFLTAGVLCLGIPRVEMAGRVFFGVGAVLVPMNFAAAQTIYDDRDLNSATIWLAGSIVTAAFYAAVAWTGLGRLYAVGAGLAIISATAAGIDATNMTAEWIALPFISVGLAMVLSSVSGPPELRERLGPVWTVIGQGAATLATAFVVLVAAADTVDPYIDGTRWFLPLTLAAFALAAVAAASLTRRTHFAGVALVTGAGAGVAIAYGLSLPEEGWAITSAGTAAVIAIGLAATVRANFSMSNAAQDGVLVVSMAALSLAGLISYFVMQAHFDGIDAVANRWFLAATFALALVTFAAAAASPRGRSAWGLLTSTGIVGSAIGASLAVAFALAWPVEAYAITLAVGAAALGFVALACRNERVRGALPTPFADVALAGGVACSAAAAYFTAIVAAGGEDVSTRWFAAITMTSLAAFYATVATGLRHRIGAAGFAASLTGVALALAYGLDADAQYYAFALLVPALALMTAVRFASSRADSLLEASWRLDAGVFAWAATIAGATVALGAVAAHESSDDEWAAASRALLPIAMALATVVAALDASRGRRSETSAALAFGIATTAVTLPYVVDPQAAWYGAALASAGIGLALMGRTLKLSWIDYRSFDLVALAAVVLATLPFEEAYASEPGIGAAVHMAAAAFFASAALLQRSRLSLGEVIDMKQLAGIPLSSVWLYPAGLSAAVGYVFVLRTIGGGDSAEPGTLAVPMMTISIAFLVTAMALRLWRPELRGHLYVLALAAALVSLGTADGATSLATLTLVFGVASLLAGAYEDSPFVAAPAAVFAFIAVPAWRAHLDAPLEMLPISYTAVGAAAYVAALALRNRVEWALALRAAGGIFAIAAPAIGFAVLSEQSLAEPETSALYQWSTAAVAIGGLLALVEAMASGRRWIIVPASAVLTLALLLQIATLQPENTQAYTAVIGAYLVLLGVVGLGRLKLIPEASSYASYVEALGAATIMLPSFVQSLEGSWHYQWILLVEATLFLAAAVGLRRRGLLGASLLFLVLVAGRALFDAVNALPNWIVVALCGAGLLAGGVAILAGRDRWDRWQQAIIGWWDDMGADHALNGR